MSLNFFKNFAKVKKDQIGSGLVELAANLDPNAVSEAAIKQKMDEHNEYVRQLVDAKQEFAREKREFDEIQLLYNKKLAAAERAQLALDKNPADTEAAQALNELVEGIEKMLVQLEKEKREFENAEKFLVEMQSAADGVAKELLNLREQVTATKQSIKQAEIDSEQARKERERAETIAGLRSNVNKYDTALSALQKQADAKSKEAEVHRIAAEQLRKPVTPVSTAAARFMDEVDNQPSSTETLQERLNRLKAVSK
ncbi:MAG: hypothetical protein ACXW2E_01215 [Nitrososphaeraceae archaeon]